MSASRFSKSSGKLPDKRRARQIMKRGDALTQRMLSSRLTRGIVVLNLGGLVALLGGFLYLNQFREGLIDARVQSLQTQGEIITAAVAASATIDTDAIDPEKLLKLAPGESYSADGGQEATGFSLNPERIGPLLRNLVSRAPARAHL
jgi:two-component system sensor histidine kinase ChvG